MNAGWIIFSRILFASAAGMAVFYLCNQWQENAGTIGSMAHALLEFFLPIACVFLAITARRIGAGSCCVVGRIGWGLVFVVGFVALWNALQHWLLPGAENAVWTITNELAVCGACLLIVSRAGNDEVAGGVCEKRSIAPIVALVGCSLFAVSQLVDRSAHAATEAQPVSVISRTVRIPRATAWDDDARKMVTRIGFPNARSIAYAAVDYQSGPSRRFRGSLDDLQRTFGADLAVSVLPVAASDEGREIHRILLALRQADPRMHAQVEARLLNERLTATPSAIIDAAVSLIGADRFHAVFRFHKDKIDALMDRASAMFEANCGEARGVFPCLIAGESVLIGFDGNPVRLETHIADSLGMRRLSEIPYRPVLHLVHETVDIGQVSAGAKIFFRIFFQNTGNESLTIGLVKAGPAAHVVEVPDTAVHPGNEASIAIALIAPTHGDSIDRDILIGSNDGTGFRKLRLRGQIVPIRT